MPKKKKKKSDSTISIKGGVHAKRDVIMGDQYNDAPVTSRSRT